jgi:phosphopantetheinyl transferase (holo-ACP synthase)
MKKDNNPQGLGNDIIEIERIRQSIERHGQHFLNRIFTHREQDYWKPLRKLLAQVLAPISPGTT